MKKRWTCPEGTHAGVLAPARLRKTDVRRYCLACSEEKGILVERLCPSQERAKAKRQEQRAKKRDRKTAAKKREPTLAQLRARREARQDRETVLGIHVPTHFFRVCRDTPVISDSLKNLERPFPSVTVRRRRAGTYTTGHAYSHSAKIVLTIPVKCSWGKLAVIVAHEVAHVCSADEEHHGPGWRSTFLAILEQAYGMRTSWPTKDGKPVSYHDAHTIFEEMMDDGLGNPPPGRPRVP